MPSQTIKRTMDQRRALIAECRRRRQAGESAKDICAALQINIKTFHKWAKIHGFRLGDLDPGNPRARAALPPGPSAHTSTGRYMRGEGLGRPRSGGRQALLTADEKDCFTKHPSLAATEAQKAMDAGDTARAEAIIKLIRKGQSLARGIDELRSLARQDPDYDHRYEHYMATVGWKSKDELTACWNYSVLTDKVAKFPDKVIPKAFTEKWLNVSREDYAAGIARLNARRTDKSENDWRAEYGLPPLPEGETFTRLSPT